VRADRLISMVMLLQTHEKMTAEELDSQLEVSRRTIYRDIIALNISGVPIYTDRGPGGGISLLESYRTSLTGMNEDEIRALFMVNIPAVLADLGFEQKLKSAFLKLAAALPTNQQKMQILTQQRIYLDSTPWKEKDTFTPHINIIHQAIWQDKLIRLVYRGSFGTQIEVELAPLGLVAKMNTWYLVGIDDGYIRVIRVMDILQVEPLNQAYDRDESFDLAAFWKSWCQSTQDRRRVLEVKIKVTQNLERLLAFYLGEGVKFNVSDVDDSDDAPMKSVTIWFDNIFQAREKILSMGRAAKVIEPEALKLSVIDFARQIIDYYDAKDK
jgi:predicted DNA-binding transcriptional regulator YafY